MYSTRKPLTHIIRFIKNTAHQVVDVLCLPCLLVTTHSQLISGMAGYFLNCFKMIAQCVKSMPGLVPEVFLQTVV